MAGVKGKSGGARENAGPKALHDRQTLLQALDLAVPNEKRKAILERVTECAIEGDMQAAKLAMAYRFGTPPSGDEIKLKEALEVEVDKIFAGIEKHLGPDALRKLRVGLLADARGGGAAGSGSGPASS